MACKKLADKPRHEYRPDHNNKDNPKILYKKCIGNYYNGYYASLINSFNMYSEGNNAFSGGYMEQPAKFAELMSLIDNLIRENQSEIQRKEKLANGKRPSKR